MKRNSGFTIIELMLVIAVAGILLSMAVPAMQMFSSNAKQTGAVNDFIAAMHVARNTAITSNARVTMCASTDGATCGGAWNSGWILFRDSNSNQAVDGTERIISSSAPLDGLTLSSSQYGSFFMYRPTGRIMNASVGQNTGEFTLCDDRGPDHAKVVIIELSGRPKVSATTRSGSTPSCI